MFLVEKESDLLHFFKYTGDNALDDRYFLCDSAKCKLNWESRETQCCHLNLCNLHLEMHNDLTDCTFLKETSERLRKIESNK